MNCKCNEWDKIGYCVKCGLHFTDQFSVLQQEIELLREDKKKLNEMLNSANHNAAISQGERDEWKRRAGIVWDCSTAWTVNLPEEAFSWFEEK